MMSAAFLRAVLVVARRDIVATVMSRGFLIWLATPIIALAFGLLIGVLTGGNTAKDEPAAAAVLDPGGNFAPWISDTARQERARSRYATLRSRFEALRPGELVMPSQLGDTQLLSW